MASPNSTRAYHGRERWKRSGKTLGAGGQGDVFVVTDMTGQFAGEWALKRLRKKDRVARFKREVEVLRRLDHDNIIKLVDAHVEEVDSEDASYLVMPIAAHGDLESRLALYKGNIDSVVAVAKQIAEALHYAHEQGIVHRDVKPGNILFPSVGHDVWVADFGLSFDRSADRDTPSNEVVGPRYFLAPELEQGGQITVTAAVDVYSLGKLIFHMFSGGKLVFREFVLDARYDELFVNGERARKLRLLLARMIAGPEQRIQSMEEIVQELRAIEEWERAALVPLTSPDSIAGFEELRRRSIRARQVVNDDQAARDQENHTRQHVTQSFGIWLKTQLEGIASGLGGDDNIEVYGGEIGSMGQTVHMVPTEDNRAYVMLMALELRLKMVEDKFTHRLRIHLCEGPKEIVTGSAHVIGSPDPKPIAKPVRDLQFAMIPAYVRTSAPDAPALSGFLTKKSRIGTVHQRIIQRVPGAIPRVDEIRAPRTTLNFDPDLSQRLAFKASEWANGGETLDGALKEAVDCFIEHVLDGSRSFGD